MDSYEIISKNLLKQHRVALSPDGRFVAYVVRDSNATNEDLPAYTPDFFNGANVWITDLELGETSIPMKGIGNSWSPSWSSDSQTLAFYADLDGYVKLYLWSVKSHSHRKATNLAMRGYSYPMDKPHWLGCNLIVAPLLPEKDRFPGYRSPNRDSYSDASDYIGKENTATKLFWPKEQPAEEGPPVTMGDPYHPFRADLGIINIATEEVQRIEFDFNMKLPFPSPDGKKIAMTAFGKRDSIGAYRWTEPVYVYDIKDKKTTLIADDLVSGGNFRHDPTWSSDSSKLAFVYDHHVTIVTLDTLISLNISVGEQKLDTRFLLWHPEKHQLLIKSGAKLLLVDKEQVNTIRPPKDKRFRGVMRRANESYFWSPDGQSCVAWISDDVTGNHGFAQLNLVTGQSSILNDEPASYYATPFQNVGGSLADISADGTKVIFGKESINIPLELWSMDTNFNQTKKITKINKESKFSGQYNSQVLVWQDSNFKSRRGVLLLPNNKLDDKLPLVVGIYPGISTASSVHSWDYDVVSAVLPPQCLLANGYAVFIPEIYHGKASIATDITKELLLAIRAVAESAPIDHKNMAILGHSFGGYAVNTVITNTTIFQAAISVSGFGNLGSHYGMFHINNGEIDGYGCQGLETGQFGIGAPWERPLDYINNSPLYNLNRVETPLLLLGGSLDPIYQPEEMLVGLERLGKRVQCFNYQGEGHTPQEWIKSNRKDVTKRIINWLDANLNQ